MTTVAPKVWTEEALLALPVNGSKYELVSGELHTMPPAGPDHGLVSMNVGSMLRDFCRPRRLGVILDGQTGFYMKNGDLFSPDVSFVAAARWQQMPREMRKKFIRGSPDLAVEVLSPSEPRSHDLKKIASYLENDAVIAWLVDPEIESVTVYTREAPPQKLAAGATLAAEPLLPGFALPVASLFEDVDED